MSLREVGRLKAVQEAIARRITQKSAALMMGVSERQARRLVRAVRAVGDKGIVHKGRGAASNRKTAEEVRDRAMALYRRKYVGFGPLLVSEKLKELDGIAVSDETLRKWLMEAGLWEKRRKRACHRQWRPRKECFGEMLQMDGSHHDWLEVRGPQLVFMGYIDDATNTVYGRFYGHEGTLPAMDGFKRYARRYGLPRSVYLDRHTTYKSTRELTSEEELEGCAEPLSQFERAMKELGVEVIHAYSPQAKGRVERLFGVLQDRLVKEMRLAGIKTMDEANEFLDKYLPAHNKRFSVCPANPTDMHVKVPRHFDLDRHLCVKTERTVRNDSTIAHNGRLYLMEGVRTKKVTVEERIDGSMRITGDGGPFRHREITDRPERQIAVKRRGPRKPHVPPKDHPWRHWKIRPSRPLTDTSATQTE
jgi:transposase